MSIKIVSSTNELWKINLLPYLGVAKSIYYNINRVILIKSSTSVFTHNSIIQMVKEIAERYLLKTLLGEGRFGWVYKAKDYRTSKKVAVKIVRKDKIALSIFY